MDSLRLCLDQPGLAIICFFEIKISDFQMNRKQSWRHERSLPVLFYESFRIGDLLQAQSCLFSQLLGHLISKTLSPKLFNRRGFRFGHHEGQHLVDQLADDHQLQGRRVRRPQGSRVLEVHQRSFQPCFPKVSGFRPHHCLEAVKS